MAFEQKLRKFLLQAWPIFFLLVFSVLVFYRITIFHKATFYINQDNVDQAYSWYQKLATSLHHGYLPLWDAGTYSGRSFGGQFIEGVFYPFNLLFSWLLGTKNGIDLIYLDYLIVLHFFLASLGMYLFSKRLGLKAYVALIPGILFAFTGVLLARAISQTCIFLGLCLIPWALYFAALYRSRKKWYFLIFSGASLGLAILAGHLQPFVCGFIAVGLYLLFEEIGGKKRVRIGLTLRKMLLQMAVVAGAGLIVATPQLALSSTYMNNAYRWVGADKPVGPGEKINLKTYVSVFNANPDSLLNIYNPWMYPAPEGNEIFVGLVALVVLVAGIIFRKEIQQNKHWQSKRLFIWSVIIIGLIISLGYWSPLPAFLYKLPFLYQVRSLSRYLILVDIGLCLLAGFSFQAILETKQNLTNKQTLIFLLLASWLGLSSIVTFRLSKYNLPNGNQVFAAQLMLASLACLALVLFFKRKAWLYASLLSLLILSVGLNIRRFIFITTPQIYSPAVYDSLKKSRVINYLEGQYGKYRIIIDNQAIPQNSGDVLPLQTTWGYGATAYKPYFDYLLPGMGDYSSPLYDNLNVRYVISNRDVPGQRLIMSEEDKSLYLYERKNYKPKAFLEGQINNSGEEIESSKQVEQKEYSDLRQVYEVSANAQSKLIFSEQYYPGWRAYVDGKEVNIGKTSLPGSEVELFKFIWVPSGKHTVELKYHF